MSSAPWRRLFLAGVYVVMLGLLAVPIASVEIPPLGDYPNHLARMHILSSIADSPELAANYLVEWKVAPYLAMELIIPRLTRYMSVYTAGRIFVYLCLVQFVIGTAAVHAALFRKFSVFPAVSALFAYNYVVSLGFLNYLFGIGLWLLAFAGWIELSRRSVRWRLLLGSILSLAVFFCHFFAFFGYALSVGAFELGIIFASRHSGMKVWATKVWAPRAAVTSAAFIGPGLIYVLLCPKMELGATHFGSVTDRVLALLTPFVFPGAWVGLGLVPLLIISLLSPPVRRRLTIAPPMRLPLMCLGIAAVLVPGVLSGVWGMEYRLPAGFIFLLIASCSWRDIPRPVAMTLTAAMTAGLAVNVAMITFAWRPAGQHFDTFRRALSVIPRGARVIAFYEHSPFDSYVNVPALAMIERDASMPLLFTNPMLPVSARPNARTIAMPKGHNIPLSDLTEGAHPAEGQQRRDGIPFGWPKSYDYAIGLGVGSGPPPAHLELLTAGEIFSVYKVNP